MTFFETDGVIIRFFKHGALVLNFENGLKLNQTERIFKLSNGKGSQLCI